MRRLRPALYLGETSLYDNVAAVDASILAPDKRFVVNSGMDRYPISEGVEAIGLKEMATILAAL